MGKNEIALDHKSEIRLNTEKLYPLDSMSKISRTLSELNYEEIEISLKALGYYQVHLFDELSNQNADKNMIESEVKNATNAIKKIHAILEELKKKA